MAIDFETLLNLWTEPLPDSTSEAAELFRALYTDPVLVNGAPLRAEDMVHRARNMQRALGEMQREVLDVCDAGDKVAVAFRLSGRQVGDFPTSAGVLAPTGQWISMRVIDILTLREGRISEVAMVADELGAFAAIGAADLISR